MADPTIRTNIVAVLLKLETTEGVDASPSPTTDAIGVELGSIQTSSPWTTEAGNEATGSAVGAAPLVVGQPATISFNCRVRGAGATYTASIKPPLHQTLQACGKRGQFLAAITAAALTAGGASSATLAAAFPAVADSILGLPLNLTAGVGAGARPTVIDYSAGRVATLADIFGTPLDTTTFAGLPASWTYVGTTPADASARATDQPSATIYLYRDGKLRKFVGCRGVAGGTGQTARPGFINFKFSGIYAGDADVALPTNLVVNLNTPPVLAQGSAISSAVLLKGKALPISSWTWDNGGDVASTDDPNSNFGFSAGFISDRTPTLKLDPLATTIAVRNSISDIGAGTLMSAVIRYGSVAGNSWSLTFPKMQLTGSDDGDRDKLMTEQMTLQALNSGVDGYSRDSEGIIAFF